MSFNAKMVRAGGFWRGDGRFVTVSGVSAQSPQVKKVDDATLLKAPADGDG